MKLIDLIGRGALVLRGDPMACLKLLDVARFYAPGHEPQEDGTGTCSMTPPLPDCFFVGKVITQHGQCLCMWRCETEEGQVTVVIHCD